MKIFLFLLLLHQAAAVGFIKHFVERVAEKPKYDLEKCRSRPEFMIGHFVSREVYPNEIHTFFVNEWRPSSEKEAGRYLKPVTRRILKVDREHAWKIDSWKVMRLEVCLPNEDFLRPSYQGMGLESD